MRVVFRVDSATYIGGGHLMRCMALAEKLRARSVQVNFICRELSGNLISLLREKDISVSVLQLVKMNSALSSSNDCKTFPRALQDEDAEKTILALSENKPNWLIVDHYELDTVWEKKLKQHCGRIMVIEDLAKRQHNCDLLLDQNYSKESELRYKSLVPKWCQVLLGPSFALMSEEYRLLRQMQTVKGGTLKRLLVFFTLGDDRGETLKAMQGIAIFGKAIHVDVVVGKENTDIFYIKQMCVFKKWGYHCQIDYMPNLIAKADLVIGGGGSSNWERCVLGVPALVGIIAGNQVSIAQALHSAGVVRNLGWVNKLQALDYANALGEINEGILAQMSEKAFALVDADGAERVSDILMAQ